MRRRIQTLTKTEMLIDDCFNLPEDELGPLFEKAYSISRARFSDKIAFHMPGMVHYETEFYAATDPYRFPSISISGVRCSLNCEHCRGQLLETMIPALTPEALWKTCQKVKENGGKGCLVSGGSTLRGDTPLLDFIPVLGRVKRELGLNVVVHTGIVYPETAKALGEARIDGAMLDIIGSDETLREIYHLDKTVDIFDTSMALLEEAMVPVMPHVIAGLHYGQLKGEANAIRMIARHDPVSVIVVAFMPLDDTPMEKITPSSPMDIARVILATRLGIPDKPVILGCARPLGDHRRETDRLAIDAGVNGIAYPTEEGYSYAQGKGLSMTFSVECCSLMGNSFK